jgi:hypothetical protein
LAFKDVGTIRIDLEGVTWEETERYRAMIHTLLSSGVLNIKNGKAILSFDSDGDLAEIEAQVKRFKKDKPLLDPFHGVKVELLKPTTQTKSGT